jgi:hypothetical protein
MDGYFKCVHIEITGIKTILRKPALILFHRTLSEIYNLDQNVSQVQLDVGSVENTSMSLCTVVHVAVLFFLE